jgi:hypothetical protein
MGVGVRVSGLLELRPRKASALQTYLLLVATAPDARIWPAKAVQHQSTVDAVVPVVHSGHTALRSSEIRQGQSPWKATTDATIRAASNSYPWACS